MSVIMNGVLVVGGVVAGVLAIKEHKEIQELKAERKKQIYHEAKLDRQWKGYFEGTDLVVTDDEIEGRR